MKTITVLLADDNTLIREGLRALLQLEADIEVVGEAGNGHQAVAMASNLVPDVVVMDISMPLLNGLDAIPRIRESIPASTKVIVLSAHTEDAYIQQAKVAGASGYLVKQNTARMLPAAIRDAYQGKPFSGPSSSSTGHQETPVSKSNH